MFFVYTPEGGEAQRWTYNPQKLRASEAESLEKRTGWDLDEFNQHVAKGSIIGRRALLWMFLRRTHLSLRFEDVDFAVSEVEVQFDKDELATILAEVERQEPSAERDSALTMLAEQMATASEPEGKAPASSAV